MAENDPDTKCMHCWGKGSPGQGKGWIVFCGGNNDTCVSAAHTKCAGHGHLNKKDAEKLRYYCDGCSKFRGLEGRSYRLQQLSKAAHAVDNPDPVADSSFGPGLGLGDLPEAAQAAALTVVADDSDPSRGGSKFEEGELAEGLPESESPLGYGRGIVCTAGIGANTTILRGRCPAFKIGKQKPGLSVKPSILAWHEAAARDHCIDFESITVERGGASARKTGLGGRWRFPIVQFRAGHPVKSQLHMFNHAESGGAAPKKANVKLKFNVELGAAVTRRRSPSSGCTIVVDVVTMCDMKEGDECLWDYQESECGELKFDSPPADGRGESADDPSASQGDLFSSFFGGSDNEDFSDDDTFDDGIPDGVPLSTEPLPHTGGVCAKGPWLDWLLKNIKLGAADEINAHFTRVDGNEWGNAVGWSTLREELDGCAGSVERMSQATRLELPESCRAAQGLGGFDGVASQFDTNVKGSKRAFNELRPELSNVGPDFCPLPADASHKEFAGWLASTLQVGSSAQSPGAPLGLAGLWHSCKFFETCVIVYDEGPKQVFAVAPRCPRAGERAVAQIFVSAEGGVYVLSTGRECKSSWLESSDAVQRALKGLEGYPHPNQDGRGRGHPGGSMHTHTNASPVKLQAVKALGAQARPEEQGPTQCGLHNEDRSGTKFANAIITACINVNNPPMQGGELGPNVGSWLHNLAEKRKIGIRRPFGRFLFEFILWNKKEICCATHSGTSAQCPGDCTGALDALKAAVKLKEAAFKKAVNDGEVLWDGELPAHGLAGNDRLDKVFDSGVLYFGPTTQRGLGCWDKGNGDSPLTQFTAKTKLLTGKPSSATVSVAMKSPRLWAAKNSNAARIQLLMGAAKSRSPPPVSYEPMPTAAKGWRCSSLVAQRFAKLLRDSTARKGACAARWHCMPRGARRKTPSAEEYEVENETLEVWDPYELNGLVEAAEAAHGRPHFRCPQARCRGFVVKGTTSRKAKGSCIPGFNKHGPRCIRYNGGKVGWFLPANYVCETCNRNTLASTPEFCEANPLVLRYELDVKILPKSAYTGRHTRAAMRAGHKKSSFAVIACQENTELGFQRQLSTLKFGLVQSARVALNREPIAKGSEQPQFLQHTQSHRRFKNVARSTISTLCFAESKLRASCWMKQIFDAQGWCWAFDHTFWINKCVLGQPYEAVFTARCNTTGQFGPGQMTFTKAYGEVAETLQTIELRNKCGSAGEYQKLLNGVRKAGKLDDESGQYVASAGQVLEEDTFAGFPCTASLARRAGLVDYPGKLKGERGDVDLGREIRAKEECCSLSLQELESTHGAGRGVQQVYVDDCCHSRHQLLQLFPGTCSKLSEKMLRVVCPAQAPVEAVSLWAAPDAFLAAAQQASGAHDSRGWLSLAARWAPKQPATGSPIDGQVAAVALSSGSMTWVLHFPHVNASDWAAKQALVKLKELLSRGAFYTQPSQPGPGFLRRCRRGWADVSFALRRKNVRNAVCPGDKGAPTALAELVSTILGPTCGEGKVVFSPSMPMPTSGWSGPTITQAQCAFAASAAYCIASLAAHAADEEVKVFPWAPPHSGGYSDVGGVKGGIAHWMWNIWDCLTPGAPGAGCFKRELSTTIKEPWVDGNDVEATDVRAVHDAMLAGGATEGQAAAGVHTKMPAGRRHRCPLQKIRSALQRLRVLGHSFPPMQGGKSQFKRCPKTGNSMLDIRIDAALKHAECVADEGGVEMHMGVGADSRGIAKFRVIGRGAPVNENMHKNFRHEISNNAAMTAEHLATCITGKTATLNYSVGMETLGYPGVGHDEAWLTEFINGVYYTLVGRRPWPTTPSALGLEFPDVCKHQMEHPMRVPHGDSLQKRVEDGVTMCRMARAAARARSPKDDVGELVPSVVDITNTSFGDDGWGEADASDDEEPSSCSMSSSCSGCIDGGILRTAFSGASSTGRSAASRLRADAAAHGSELPCGQISGPNGLQLLRDILASSVEVSPTDKPAVLHVVAEFNRRAVEAGAENFLTKKGTKRYLEAFAKLLSARKTRQQAREASSAAGASYVPNVAAQTPMPYPATLRAPVMNKGIAFAPDHQMEQGDQGNLPTRAAHNAGLASVGLNRVDLGRAGSTKPRRPCKLCGKDKDVVFHPNSGSYCPEKACFLNAGMQMHDGKKATSREQPNVWTKFYRIRDRDGAAAAKEYMGGELQKAQEALARNAAPKPGSLRPEPERRSYFVMNKESELKLPPDASRHIEAATEALKQANASVSEPDPKRQRAPVPVGQLADLMRTIENHGAGSQSARLALEAMRGAIDGDLFAGLLAQLTGRPGWVPEQVDGLGAPSQPERGAVIGGLGNVGNTCYINTVAQPLAAVHRLDPKLSSSESLSTTGGIGNSILTSVAADGDSELLPKLVASVTQVTTEAQDRRPAEALADYIWSGKLGHGTAGRFKKREPAGAIELLETALTCGGASVLGAASTMTLQDIRACAACSRNHAQGGDTPRVLKATHQGGQGCEEVYKASLAVQKDWLEAEPLVDYKCDGCKAEGQSTRLHAIAHAPAVLFIDVKRLSSGGSAAGQFRECFSVHLEETLSLPQVERVDAKAEAEAGYRQGTNQIVEHNLAAVMCHTGSRTSGHWWAYVRYDDHWVVASDANTRAVGVFTVMAGELRGQSSVCCLVHARAKPGPRKLPGCVLTELGLGAEGSGLAFEGMELTSNPLMHRHLDSHIKRPTPEQLKGVEVGRERRKLSSSGWERISGGHDGGWLSDEAVNFAAVAMACREEETNDTIVLGSFVMAALSQHGPSRFVARTALKQLKRHNVDSLFRFRAVVLLVHLGAHWAYLALCVGDSGETVTHARDPHGAQAHGGKESWVRRHFACAREFWRAFCPRWSPSKHHDVCLVGGPTQPPDNVKDCGVFTALAAIQLVFDGDPRRCYFGTTTVLGSGRQMLAQYYAAFDNFVPSRGDEGCRKRQVGDRGDDEESRDRRRRAVDRRAVDTGEDTVRAVDTSEYTVTEICDSDDTFGSDDDPDGRSHLFDDEGKISASGRDDESSDGELQKYC